MVLVFEGPCVYQFRNALRLYVAAVMSADTSAEAHLYEMGAPPIPLDVWRLDNMWQYLQSALAADR